MLVDLARFHRLRDGLVGNAAPATLDQVTEASDFLWWALGHVQSLHDVEVSATDRAEHRVVGWCHFGEDVSESEVAHELEDVWDRLRHEFWEAHTVLVSRGQVELEGATRHGPDGACLTVHVLAQQDGRLPAQRRP